MSGAHEAIVVYGTTWCPDCKRDKRGFVITDRTMQTSLKGFFAAGDVRAGATAQAATAAGEGAAAARMIREYLQTEA
jgi:thioredoxin reductase (NADPH)